MGSWTDYDPSTGITEKCIYDEDTDALHIRKEQDCTALQDHNKELKATRATDIGIKKDLWLYMSIPIGVQYELLWKHGVDITKRDHWPRLFDIVNKEYPDLKTTDKMHSFRNGSRRVIVGSSRQTGSAKPESSTAPGRSSITT